MPQDFSLFDECRANARAFDALQDIAQALESLCDYLGKDWATDEHVKAARAALKKGGF
jgi:hypothetical protein